MATLFGYSLSVKDGAFLAAFFLDLIFFMTFLFLLDVASNFLFIDEDEKYAKE